MTTKGIFGSAFVLAAILIAAIWSNNMLDNSDIAADGAFTVQQRKENAARNQAEYDKAFSGNSATKATPAQKCADPRVVDLLTTNIREATARSERLLSDKPSSSYGSNGSYAKPAADNEAKIDVVVRGILATDYNPKIDRVRCQMTYLIEGAERTNVLALLEGKGPERTSIYFVQPDENNRPVVSW